MPTLTLSARQLAEPTFRLRPSEDAAGFAVFHDHHDEPSVFVRNAVLDQIIAHCHHEGPNEAIGFLAGRVFRDDRGIWAVVSDVRCCEHARRTRVTVATTDRDEQELDEWRQGDGLALDRLGWWHSHYELRFAHYSGVDLENQRLWCPRDWQVGLLVLVDDGVARVRCYRGAQSEPLTPLHREDGTTEPLPTERLRLPSRETLPTGEPAKTPPTTVGPSLPPIDWRRVATAVAAFLLVATLLGMGAGVIPTPAELKPPADVGLPISTYREAQHAHR